MEDSDAIICIAVMIILFLAGLPINLAVICAILFVLYINYQRKKGDKPKIEKIQRIQPV